MEGGRGGAGRGRGPVEEGASGGRTYILELPEEILGGRHWGETWGTAAGIPVLRPTPILQQPFLPTFLAVQGSDWCFPLRES